MHEISSSTWRCARFSHRHGFFWHAYSAKTGNTIFYLWPLLGIGKLRWIDWCMSVCCEADVWVLVGKELGLPYAIQNPFQVKYQACESEAQTDETNCRVLYRPSKWIKTIIPLNCSKAFKMIKSAFFNLDQTWQRQGPLAVTVGHHNEENSPWSHLKLDCATTATCHRS